MQAMVLSACHDLPSAGHQGIERTKAEGKRTVFLVWAVQVSGAVRYLL